MRLTEDKISHIAHLLCDGSQNKGWVEYIEPPKVLKLTKKVLAEYSHLDEEIDQVVRKKIETYKRGVMEGSREWDVLYRKHFEEEMNKRWR